MSVTPDAQLAPDPPHAPVPTAPRRRARWWDILLTVVFLVGMLGVGVWGSFYGLLALAFMDSCPPTGCDGDPIYLRWLGGAVFGIVAVMASVLLLAFRRRAWWVALLGLVGMFLIWSELLVATIAYSLR